jgi:hypothetical protein
VRFVLAILAFLVSLACLVLGIGQRTFLQPPATVESSVSTQSSAAFTLVDASVLRQHPGTADVTVSGSDRVFVSYGRTADVTGWLSGLSYVHVSVGPNGDLKHTTVTPTTADDSGNLDPRGSDLWLQQYTGTSSVTTSLLLPKGMSVLLASDGTKAAPDSLALSWHQDRATPLAGPLFVASGFFALLGVFFYILAFSHLRRSRGPRRGNPPRFGRRRPSAYSAVRRGHQPAGTRRGRGRPFAVLLPTMLLGTLALTGCSSDYWPQFGSAGAATTTATPTPTATADTADAAPPAVTSEQFANILDRVSGVAKKADAKHDKALIKTRFSGPALTERIASYTIAAKDKKADSPEAIRDTDVAYLLPQSTAGWPRSVFAVVQDTSDKTVPSLGLVLTQETARSNYMVNYSIQLQASAQMPHAPAAYVGSQLLATDSNVLLLPPDETAAAYGTVLARGKAAPDASLFQATGDEVRTKLGKAYKDKTRKNLDKALSIAFSSKAGTGEIVPMTTNESGSLVAASLDEIEKVTVKGSADGASVGAGKAVAALSGVASSESGISSVYGYQLLFYVPSAGSNQKIQVLGATRSLNDASEIK